MSECEEVEDRTDNFYMEWKYNAYDIPNYKKGSIYIKGKKWYFKCKDDENDNSISLMKDIKDCPYGSYIICYTPNKREVDTRLFRQKNGTEVRLYSCFRDEISLYDYMDSMTSDNKCFYEMILGKTRQKPKFDIDIETDKIEIFDNTRNTLIESILIVLDKHNIKYNLNNLMLFTSHGDKKKSGHIILDKLSHLNNEEAQYFYDEVVLLCGDYKQYIDHKVYSKKQQFRIVGSSKLGADRIKTFNRSFVYKEKLYIYNMDYASHYNKLPNITEENKAFRKRFKNVKILLGSLISFSNYETIKMKFPETKNNIVYDKINDIDIDKALKLINKDDFQYVNSNNSNNGIIELRRLKPSLCPTCNKKHMKENAYLFIKDNNVYFNCRRNTKSTKL